MSKPVLSIVYLILSFMIILILLFYGTSQVVAFYKTGADPKNILMLDSESVNDYYQPKVAWKEPHTNEGRRMEIHTLEKIAKDYTASYYHQFQAQKTGNSVGLHDYFTEKSRNQMEDLIAWQTENQHATAGTSIVHDLQLDFYSEDGTIVTLTDQVITYQEASVQNELKLKSYDTASYRVMLLLEDNFWRIRHKVKGDLKVKDSIEAIAPKMQKATVQNNRIFVEDQPFTIRGMNYYPMNHPWQEMWENFDSVDFRSDFKLISKTGFNTIRVFVPYHQFGEAQVLENELLKLKTLMDQAEDENLKVIITLFDFFLSYSLEEWTLADRHAEAIVTALKDHPTLLAWDVKNEPDLDFELHNEKKVLSWLDFMVKRIKGYDPHTLLTIGWSQPEQSHHLEEELDLLSFHFYRAPEELEEFLKKQQLSKPLFIGETGMHSYKSWWYPIGNDEKEQREYYSQITQLIEAHKLSYALWTLYDFPKVPSNVAGKWPWQKKPQKEYGLIDIKGDKKESFEFLKAFNQKNNND